MDLVIRYWKTCATGLTSTPPFCSPVQIPGSHAKVTPVSLTSAVASQTAVGADWGRVWAEPEEDGKDLCVNGACCFLTPFPGLDPLSRVSAD